MVIDIDQYDQVRSWYVISAILLSLMMIDPCPYEKSQLDSISSWVHAIDNELKCVALFVIGEIVGQHHGVVPCILLQDPMDHQAPVLRHDPVIDLNWQAILIPEQTERGVGCGSTRENQCNLGPLIIKNVISFTLVETVAQLKPISFCLYTLHTNLFKNGFDCLAKDILQIVNNSL